MEDWDWRPAWSCGVALSIFSCGLLKLSCVGWAAGIAYAFRQEASRERQEQHALCVRQAHEGLLLLLEVRSLVQAVQGDHMCLGV